MPPPELAAGPPPDISVVIPAYNEASYVEGALASVAAQAWPIECLEAIVVANGCTDRTAEVVWAYAASHPQLRVLLVDEPVANVARAKNRGADRANGRLLVFLDADSQLAADVAARVVARAAGGDPAGSLRVTADSGDLLDRAFFGLIEHGKRLFGIKANMLYCTSEVFRDVGGFAEDLRCGEDRDLLVRLERAGLPVGHVDETWIATSPRRLHALPLRLGMVTTLGRWALAHAGIGRRWRY